MEKFDKYLQYSNLDKKQYQYEGVKWCLNNEQTEIKDCGENINLPIKGGIVADEMGLGKTITMLGTVFSNNINNKTLIVVPPILYDQWKSQIKKTLNYDALEYYGKSRNMISENMLNTSYITISTYNTVMLSWKNAENLHEIKWNRVIFDEAHHLRNQNNQYNACKSLKKNITWLVTGTPIQNNMNDFYNLCKMLGIPETYYQKLIHNEKKQEEYKKYKKYNHNFKKLEVTMNSFTKLFILQRTKKEVGLNLKDYSCNNTNVEWKCNEIKTGEIIHSKLKCCNGTTDNLTEKDIKKSEIYSKGGTLKLLTRARQVCISEGLFTKKTMQSNKIESVTDKIIDNSTNTNKKIVFCTYRKEIDIIYNILSANKLNVKYIDGRIKSSERTKIINDSPDILILQILTGNEGLNLQQYNEMYFVSPQWNPAIENQAIARCHRIGQKKDVVVYRFYMDDIIEGNETDTEDIEDTDSDGSTSSTISFDKYIKNTQEKKIEIAKTIFK